MLFDRKTNPEIISLHIPKTAGTSFRNILKNVYGENQVARFDIDEQEIVVMNQQPYTQKYLPNVKVIHGHMIYQSLIRKFELPKEYKIITWVRDPVKRVISNFYYLEGKLKEILIEGNKSFNILSKLQRSLLEYARAEINRNWQTKYLSGRDLEDFDFVGIQEYFETEVIRIAEVMQWEKIPEVLYHNKTQESDLNLPEEIVQGIREMNLDDVQLYSHALQLRKTNMNI